MKNNKNLENEFQVFYTGLTDTIKTFEYYVDWKKVENNIKDIEVSLNILNTLIGKVDFKNSFTDLLRRYPEVIEAFPILIAIRSSVETILAVDGTDKFTFEFVNKIQFDDDYVEKYYILFKETGLESLIKEKKIKNLVDYVFGVEVGMDTNARKNRTGKIMENLIFNFLSKLPNNFTVIKQASQNSIKHKFGIQIKIDKTDRKFDFALLNRTTKKLFLIEVNFYNSQGSKLKATAGEYKGLYNFLLSQNVSFLWFTDGLGWTTAKNAIEETFYNNQGQIYNIKMLKEGKLDLVIN